MPTSAVKTSPLVKSLRLAPWIAWMALPALGDVITEPTRFYAVGFDIPDHQDPPLNFEVTILDSTIFSVTEVRVGLNLVGRNGGGFASEMYVALSHNSSATSVLINRVGVTDTDPIGAGYDGWQVTFADNAPAGNIHTATLASGILTGEYAPDARIEVPSLSLPASLSVFSGGAGNGVWRLSVGDLALGGEMRLESWSLSLSGTSVVPEASSWSAGALLGVLCAGSYWRRSRRRS